MRIGLFGLEEGFSLLEVGDVLLQDPALLLDALLLVADADLHLVELCVQIPFGLLQLALLLLHPDHELLPHLLFALLQRAQVTLPPQVVLLREAARLVRVREAHLNDIHD